MIKDFLPSNRNIKFDLLTGKHYLALLFIAVFGTYYYSIVYSGFIHLDDIKVITRLLNRPPLVLKDLFFPDNVISYYRPMIELSYRLDHFMWFDSASGWHLTNVILHGINTGLVYLIARVVFSNATKNDHQETAAFCSALLYALNPLSTEAVCWVSGRSELILAFFMFCSFCLYLLFKIKEKYLYLLLSGISFFFASLTKESALVLPVLIIAFELFFNQSFSPADKKKIVITAVWFFLLTILYFLLFRRAGVDIANMKVGIGPRGLRSMSSFENVQVLFASLGFYIRKIVYPYPLNIAIDSINLVVYSILGLAVLVVLAFGWRFLRPLYRFLTVWVLATLLPPIAAAVLHIPWTQWGDRYLYVPLAAFSMVLGLGFTLFREHQKLPATFIFVLLTALFWTTTLERSYVWSDELRLWEDTAKKSDYGPVRHYYGKALLASNREAEGVEQMKKAIAKGYSYYPYHDLSNLAFEKGDYEESEAWLKKAMRDYPHNPELHLQIAGNYLRRNSAKAESKKFLLKAIDEYTLYITAQKNDASIYFRIANLYMAVDQGHRAIPFLERGIEIDNTSSSAHLAQKSLQKLRKNKKTQ